MSKPDVVLTLPGARLAVNLLVNRGSRAENLQRDWSWVAVLHFLWVATACVHSGRWMHLLSLQLLGYIWEQSPGGQGGKRSGCAEIGDLPWMTKMGYSPSTPVRYGCFLTAWLAIRVWGITPEEIIGTEGRIVGQSLSPIPHHPLLSAKNCRFIFALLNPEAQVVGVVKNGSIEQWGCRPCLSTSFYS